MNYIKEAIRTKSDKFETPPADLVHGILGISTEAGELMDHLKKIMFYGNVVDLVNIKEELGDLFWYVALICSIYGWSFEEIQELNIGKLRKRYPEEFTSEASENRDLDGERKVLEADSNKKIEVVIKGPSMSGKSTIAAIFAEALKNYGVPFYVEDYDGHGHLIERLVQAKEIVKHLKTNIVITQEQTPRKG